MELNLSLATGVRCPGAAGTVVWAQVASLSFGDAFPAEVWGGFQDLLQNFK